MSAWTATLSATLRSYELAILVASNVRGEMAGVAIILPLLAAASAWRFDILEAIAVSVLLTALLVCTAGDLLSYRVPNVVTYPGVALALAAAAFMPHGDLRSALVAVGLSASLFLAVWALSRGGIGLADVKFAVLIGAALGLPAAYTALALGAWSSAVLSWLHCSWPGP